MSKMGDIMIEIQDLLEQGDLTITEIARKLNVPTDWVVSAAENLNDYYDMCDGVVSSFVSTEGTL